MVPVGGLLKGKKVFPLAQRWDLKDKAVNILDISQTVNISHTESRNVFFQGAFWLHYAVIAVGLELTHIVLTNTRYFPETHR